MKFGMYLVRKGLVSATQLLEAMDREYESRIPLGKLAMEMRKLTPKEIMTILGLQPELRKPFGRIAIDLGFLNERDLAELLLAQVERTKSVEDHLVDMGAISKYALMAEKMSFYEDQVGAIPTS